MLDVKTILADPDHAAHKWGQRGIDGVAAVSEIATINQARVDAIHAHDAAKQQQTELSGVFKDKSASAEDKLAARTRLKPISTAIADHQHAVKAAESAIRDRLMRLDNWASDRVPEGPDESGNVEVRSWGGQPTHDFDAADHIDLGQSLGIFDFEAAARISGARFAVYRGMGARLERALASFMLDFHTDEADFEEVLTPYLVTRDAMEGTGQLPKFEDDSFRTSDDLFMIPTSEVPVTNLYRGEMLSNDELPIRHAAYSSCFRREAGSYGRDTRGLTRLHQFQKVEMVKLCTPETSYDELETMVQSAETILQRLELPYRVVELCTGDLGFAAARTYDLEVWLPPSGTYREISSCSNCEDFQARRANIRYRPEAGAKPQFVHTLNGSGLAIGRTVIALLENHQQPDGSVL
ncbi:MAG: seryl-tRNA synthetase, partial [Myxococcota bacterium]